MTIGTVVTAKRFPSGQKLGKVVFTPTPIVDRTTEHLGTGDTAIIAMRRKLLKVIHEMEEGIEPQAAQRGDLYNVRPIAIPWPKTCPSARAPKNTCSCDSAQCERLSRIASLMRSLYGAVAHEGARV